MAEFKLKAYSQKELRSHYDVSWQTFRSWLKLVPDLGPYRGKSFTPAQVEKIINHIGKP